MYSLLKGYVVRKPTEDDSNDEVNNEDGSRELVPSHRPQQENSSQSSSYGRFLSWGLEGVSYLGGQVKQRVERSLLWASTEADFPVEDKLAINMRRRNQKPEGAVEYSVGSSDTLAKIALKYDTTPSELARMNRLPSHMLYPGQVLFVPEQKPEDESTVDNNHAHPPLETSKPEVKNQHSATQGHHEKIKLTKKVSLLSDDEEEITESFLKIKAKYITDGQGVVNGVMLVTPQSVIFNPNVSEPLVMDRGRDRYSIKTPMSAITSAALFKDIAAMAIHDPLKTGRFYLDDATRESVSRQESTEFEMATTSSPMNNPTNSHNTQVPPNTGEKNELNNSRTTQGLHEPFPPSIVDRGGGTAARDNEDVSVEDQGGSFTLGNEPEEIKQIVQELLSDVISDVVAGVINEQKTELREGNTSSKDEHCVLESTSQVDKDCNSLSPVSEDSGICSPQNKWTKYQGTTSDRDQDDVCKKGLDGKGPNEGLAMHSNKGHNSDHDTSHDSVIDSVSTTSSVSGDNKRSSSFLSSLSGEVKYWLGVGNRNQVEDDHAYEEEIIPRPAASTAADDQLLYLCIRISKKHWCMCLTADGQNPQQGEVLMNRDRIRREHWFAIPAARVEHVYGFFKQNCPNINRTLSLSEEEPEEEEETIEDEEEEVMAPFSKIGKEFILDVHQQNSNPGQETSTRTPDGFSDDFAFLPDMSVESQILSEALIKKLNKNLPSRLVSHTWTLVYSTFIHGFSLKTMYRSMEDFDTPMLIVVQDDEHQIFGTVTSCPLRLSEGFYGTGQSFLFKFQDENIKVFHWQGDNDFFMKGSVDCIAFGSGGGHFGLWLDEDFYHGSSHFSETYRNETLSKNKDFLCSAVEAWTFL